MNPSPSPGRPAGRRLRDRLERLHGALAGLAQRLRESVASVVGEHAGQAVRDGVAAALGGPAGTPAPEPTRYDSPRYNYSSYAADPYAGETEDRTDSGPGPDRFWDEPRPASSPPPPAGTPPRWWPLLPAALQALAFWLRHSPSRRPLLAALGVAAVAGVVALAAGPVAGAVAATAGTMLLVAGLADDLRDAAGGLAATPDA